MDTGRRSFPARQRLRENLLSMHIHPFAYPYFTHRLGHASIVTTERYLGVRQDLQDAPCDHLGIRIPSA